MNAPRVKSYEAFERMGFPSQKTEDYKYIDVSQAFAPNFGLNINRLTIPVNPYDVFRCDVPNLSTSLYFVVNDTFYSNVLPKAHLPEGVYAGGLDAFTRQHPDLAARYYAKAALVDNNAVTALNTMLAQDGFVLYVPAGVKLERPVQLVNIFRSDVDTMANRRILVIIEPHGWYLCGNPLPCALPLSSLENTSSLDGNIYIYVGGEYKAYSLKSDFAIPPYGAFFVKTSADAELRVSHLPSAKSYHLVSTSSLSSLKEPVAKELVTNIYNTDGHV